MKYIINISNSSWFALWLKCLNLKVPSSYPLFLVSPITNHQPSSLFPGKNGAITGPGCSSSRSRSTTTFTGEPLQIRNQGISCLVQGTTIAIKRAIIVIYTIIHQLSATDSWTNTHNDDIHNFGRNSETMEDAVWTYAEISSLSCTSKDNSMFGYRLQNLATSCNERKVEQLGKRGRQTDSDKTDSDRQTDRPADRQTNPQTDRQNERMTDWPTDRDVATYV